MAIDLSSVKESRVDSVYSAGYSDGYDVGYQEGENSATADIYHVVSEETDADLDPNGNVGQQIVDYIKSLEEFKRSHLGGSHGEEQ